MGHNDQDGPDDDPHGAGAFGGHLAGPSFSMFRRPPPRTVHDELRETKATLEKFSRALDQIKDLPLQVANVMEIHKFESKVYVRLSTPHAVVDARVEPAFAEKLEAGDCVWQAGGNGQGTSGIVGLAPASAGLGVTVSVKQVVGDASVEIDGAGGGRTVAWSKKRFPDVKAGDSVLLDRGGNVIVGIVPRTADSEFAFEGDTGVTWASIGGLEDAKAALIEAVELPSKHPEIFARYGRKPAKGILLEGPPRCGKTMLAKAVASSLREGGKGGGFFHINGPEVLDKFVGVAEARVRAVFASARAYRKMTGRPAVIFIDEADALLTARGSKGPYAHVEQTMVPQFLSEMDGLEASGAIVLLATNRANQLDPAVLGHGRIDRAVYVPRPTEKVAAEIFALALRGVPFVFGKGILSMKGSGVDETEALAQAVAKQVFADDVVVKELKLQGAAIVLRLRDVINGAMVVAIVEQAKAAAIRRDLAAATSGAKGAAPSGVSPADLEAAIKLVASEERNKNHAEALAAIAPAALKTAAEDASTPKLWTPGATT